MTQRSMIVRHAIEDGMHIVSVNSPDDYEFRTAQWPADENTTSLDAIRAGVDDAWDWADRFSANGVTLYSTDAEALAEYDRIVSGSTG